MESSYATLDYMFGSIDINDPGPSIIPFIPGLAWIMSPITTLYGEIPFALALFTI